MIRIGSVLVRQGGFLHPLTNAVGIGGLYGIEYPQRCFPVVVGLLEITCVLVCYANVAELITLSLPVADFT